MRPETNKKIEEILNSLEGIRRAEPAPFFYTRVIGRLQKEQKTVWEKVSAFMARPVVVLAGIGLVLSLNVFMLFSNNSDANSAIPASISEQVISNTDNEYVLATNSSFDFENLDPQ